MNSEITVKLRPTHEVCRWWLGKVQSYHNFISSSVREWPLVNDDGAHKILQTSHYDSQSIVGALET